MVLCSYLQRSTDKDIAFSSLIQGIPVISGMIHIALGRLTQLPSLRSDENSCTLHLSVFLHDVAIYDFETVKLTQYKRLAFLCLLYLIDETCGVVFEIF